MRCVKEKLYRTKEFNTFEGVCLDPDLASVVTLFTLIMIYDDPPAKRLKVEVTHEIQTATTSSSDTP